MTPTSTFEKDGAVGIVTMCKPPHNLMDMASLGQLGDRLQEAVDAGCRSILLRSSMRHFCAGADLDVIYEERPNDETLRALWARFEDIPVPIVAAVHGAALGGGLELALMSDMIIASDTATFAMAEASLGLLPLLGGVQRITQRVGPARAKELAMFGRRHDPRAMERWGVINLVTPEEELPAVAMSWARQLAAGPTIAFGSIKLLADLSARGGSAAADARQYEANEVMWRSEDHRRGLAAFKRDGRPATATFQGN
jgi:enoyl-CoA hydratase/carnithine racemase